MVVSQKASGGVQCLDENDLTLAGNLGREAIYLAEKTDGTRHNHHRVGLPAAIRTD